MNALGRILAVHQFLYQCNGGRGAHRMLCTPRLLLRPTGRRSGPRRTDARYSIGGRWRHEHGWAIAIAGEPAPLVPHSFTAREGTKTGSGGWG